MTQFNIEIAPTSNPNIIKFIANSFLTDSKSYEFNNIDEAKSSLLAQELFYLPFVKTVYISQNFIAIEKFDIIDWEVVQQEVANSISEYLNAGKSAIEEIKTPKKVPVSIYAESTPNPTVMKFITNRTLVPGVLEYKKTEEAIHSPLAMDLFNFPFVKEVFFSNNYISVMKNDSVEWQEVMNEIRDFIRQYVESGKDVLNDNVLNNSSDIDASQPGEPSTKERSLMEGKIISLLDEYVTPAVADDGGHIHLDSFDESTKTVKVILQGACSGCPSSTVTLKNGIETLLKQMMPGEINEVIAING